MSASALELAGMLGGLSVAAAAIVCREGRLRLAFVAAAVAIAPVLVGASVWNEPRVAEFRQDTGVVAAGAVVGAGAVTFLTALFRRWPVAFPVCAIALLPLRIPVEIGGEQANLLIPLYAVIAAGAATAIWSELAERRDPRAPGAGAGRHLFWPLSGAEAWLRWLLAATLVLYAAQSAYTKDVSNAIEITGFFLVPFAVMFSLLVAVAWTRRLLGLVLAAVSAMAAVFAGVAIYQYIARDLFLNPELHESNQLHQYFRVNSLFFDPNILGRYLVLAITALGAYIAWDADRIRLGLAAAVAGLLLCGLAFSFSITSFAALVAGLAVLAVLRWRVAGGAAVAGMAGVAAVLLLVAGGPPTSDIVDERNLDSGRTDLVSGGIELARDRPLAGWGSGSFGAAFWERIEPARTTVSHSEPVTVAAEQGAIGLGVYLALLAVAMALLFSRSPGVSVARSAVAACFVAILVHSLGYAGFATDPATWALLALGVALRD